MRRRKQLAATAEMPTIDGGRGTTQVIVQNRTRRLPMIFATLGVIVAIIVGLRLVGWLPNIHNPFTTQTQDRSGPVVLKSIQDLARFEAASGNFQVLVDVKEDKSLIPDWIYSRRTLFIAYGSVNAYVDFSTIGEDAIKVSSDGKSVTINLPNVQLDKPNIDNSKTRVYDQERGLFNAIGDMFSSSATNSQEFYQLAEQKMADAAKDAGLQDRAETNTRNTLTTMMHALGFTNVTVTFGPQTTPSATPSP
jgi:hypothetical protein